MRLALLLAGALLALSLSFPAEASGPVAPTLVGPTYVGAARNWTYSGQLVVDGTFAPVPLPGRIVGVYVDGARVAETTTDAQGKYSVRLSFGVGTHAVEARAFEGEALASASPVLLVESHATWPAPPALLTVGPGFLYTQANLTWLYPWTDGGYPVTSYTIERSANGGPYAAIFTGNASSFVDDDVAPGGSYAYRATATTSWGTSNATHAGYVASSVLSNVSLLGYRLCDGKGCADIPEAGAFNTTPGANVTVEARFYGLVDEHPVSHPGLSGHTVHGRVWLPEISRPFTRTSAADGSWGGSIAGLHAYAPAAGCETFATVARARTLGQGHWETSGELTLCAVVEEEPDEH